jgi:predicted dehydrogenase
MANASDGMNYAPEGKKAAVVKPGEFVFASVHFDHGHIYGMTNSLVDAGGTLKWVYDPDPAKLKPTLEKHPGAKVATSVDQILQDKEVQLVAAAAIPYLRGDLGQKVLDSGKDYFTDKTPFTSLAQLEAAKEKVKKTGRIWAVCYSERLQNEAAIHAGNLIHSGAIGRVLQVIGTGPHRLSPASRPAWFFEREKYGGILCDIGSHQCEQYLHFTSTKDAKVVQSRIANYNNPQHPELDDFGDCMVTGDNGSTLYYRVDWFTPDGLSTWGDGRTFVLGTEGTIELRKYVDITRSKTGNHLFLMDGKGEHYVDCNGKVGFPFFGELILDCLNRTDKAMKQEHTFKAAELCLKAQAQAVKIA